MSSPTLQTRAQELTAHGMVDAPPEQMTPGAEPGGALLLPTVLAFSVGLHGVILAMTTLLPAPTLGIQNTPAELSIEVMQPPAPEIVEPEPEPAPVEMAAQPVPVREPRRAEPAAPPPPAPVMTSTEALTGPADWAHPPGEEGGTADGVPGGTGTGDGSMADAVSEAAPAPRTGPSRAELRERVMGYIRGLSGSLAGRVGYPLAARRGHLEGVVILRLRLSDDGRVLAVRMSRSSGHSVLDEAAVASVRGVDMLPPPPAGVPWDEQRELPVPIRFRLQ